MDSGLKNKSTARNVLNGINLAHSKSSDKAKGKRAQLGNGLKKQSCHREMEGFYFYAPFVSKPIQRKDSPSHENTPLQSERIYDGLCQAANGIYQLPKR